VFTNLGPPTARLGKGRDTVKPKHSKLVMNVPVEAEGALGIRSTASAAAGEISRI